MSIPVQNYATSSHVAASKATERSRPACAGISSQNAADQPALGFLAACIREIQPGFQLRSVRLCPQHRGCSRSIQHSIHRQGEPAPGTPGANLQHLQPHGIQRCRYRVYRWQLRSSHQHLRSAGTAIRRQARLLKRTRPKRGMARRSNNRRAILLLNEQAIITAKLDVIPARSVVPRSPSLRNPQDFVRLQT